MLSWMRIRIVYVCYLELILALPRSIQYNVKELEIHSIAALGPDLLFKAMNSDSKERSSFTFI